MKQIPLTQGKFAIVDDEDFHYLSRFSWHWNVDDVCMTVHDLQGKDHHIPMHKFIVTCDGGMRVYYKDRNPLNCQKENLLTISVSLGTHRNRKCKTAKNGSSPSSRYKGVSFHRDAKKWMAYVGTAKQGNRKYLGLFTSEKSAARAYNEGAREVYGDLAYQNDV